VVIRNSVGAGRQRTHDRHAGVGLRKFGARYLLIVGRQYPGAVVVAACWCCWSILLSSAGSQAICSMAQSWFKATGIGCGLESDQHYQIAQARSHNGFITRAPEIQATLFFLFTVYPGHLWGKRLHSWSEPSCRCGRAH